MDRVISAEEAGQRLKSSVPHVMAVWAARATQQVPAARDQDRPLLYDHLPQFLDGLADALLAKVDVAELCRQGQVCREHGQQRAGLPQYSIRQMIVEYDLLLDVLFDHLEESVDGGRSLSRPARNLILRAINQGIAESVDEFAQIHDSIREQFVAILAHDLRNPLSAVKTCAQLIVRKSSDREAVEMLAGRAVASVRRIDTMIRDLLDTFQVRAGKPFPVRIGRNDLSRIVQDAADELSAVHGPRFVLTAPATLQGTWCADGIRRSIENLANNAVKYGDAESPIRITVGHDAELDLVAISVHNLGSPLIAEEQAKLFRPFHRAPFAKVSGKRGWGLGLTLVQGVAQAHGGRVLVESSAEKGTTFTLLLPRYAEPLQVSSSPTAGEDEARSSA